TSLPVASHKSARDLRGSASSSADRAIDRPGGALGIGCLTCKKERASNGPCERSGCGRAADLHIAVCAARERVVFPVVSPDCLNQSVEPPARHPERACE